MTISTEEMLWAMGIAVLLGGSLAFLFWKQRQEAKRGKSQNRPNTSNMPAQTSSVTPFQLQLQAYERLILLSERIALPSLVNRLNSQGLSSREMQGLLAETIRQEFDHNITQQIYVSQEAWDAVKNLKEQNIFIINQVASFLPPDSTATDLSKSLLEMIVQNPKASLHAVVAEVLSYEAKKVLNTR
jgi:hypothetical protein